MMGDPDLPRPEKRSPERAVQQAEAQPSPQSDAIPVAGDVPQSQTGTTGHSDAQSPFDFRRLRRDDLIVPTGSFLVFIFLFLPWHGFAAAAGQASDSDTLGSSSLGADAILALMSVIAVAGAILATLEDKKRRAVSPALPDTARG